MGARFIFRKKFSPVVETVEHRVPPVIVGQRRNGVFTGYVWRPASTRSVEIRAGRFFDRSKDYRGRLGAKDQARRARALAGA